MTNVLEYISFTQIWKESQLRKVWKVERYLRFTSRMKMLVSASEQSQAMNKISY